MDTSDVISAFALVVAGIALWLTNFRRGTVDMTKPSMVFFGPDGPGFTGLPKLATHFHLYCTAERGRVVEGMYVRLTLDGESQEFDVWVYGSDGLARASGVYVGRDGVTCSHHFLLPSKSESYSFKPGNYAVEFFGSIVGDKSPKRFFKLSLDLTPEAATAITTGCAGVFFDWRPARKCYEARVENAKDRTDRQLGKLPAILSSLFDARLDGN